MKDISAMTFLKFFFREMHQWFLFQPVVLEKLLNFFLKLFVRKADIDATVSPYQLININIDVSFGNVLPVDDVMFPIYEFAKTTFFIAVQKPSLNEQVKSNVLHCFQNSIT